MTTKQTRSKIALQEATEEAKILSALAKEVKPTASTPKRSERKKKSFKTRDMPKIKIAVYNMITGKRIPVSEMTTDQLKEYHTNILNRRNTYEEYDRTHPEETEARKRFNIENATEKEKAHRSRGTKKEAEPAPSEPVE